MELSKAELEALSFIKTGNVRSVLLGSGWVDSPSAVADLTTYSKGAVETFLPVSNEDIPYNWLMRIIEAFSAIESISMFEAIALFSGGTPPASMAVSWVFNAEDGLKLKLRQ